jgi:uncharacterized membrane protein
VDCYYHNAVPSVAACVDCRQPICATCRSVQGDCPGCRLGARIDAARGEHELGGQVPPRSERRYAAPPGNPPPQSEPAAAPTYAQSSVATIRPESRALVALSYPFWPLALLALLDGAKSPFVRRQALQALGFNFGVYGLWFALSAIAAIPLIGFSAWPLLPLVVPVAVVASFVYGYKTWQGEDVHVPIVGDFIDNRLAPQ